MPADFVYLSSVKNLHSIFEKIRGAGTPPRFSLEFLKNLGFSSSSDRPVINLLKALGFLSSDGSPTERYNAYRDSTRSGQAIAAGLREGWADIFLADQRAYDKTPTQLVEVFKSVSGKGDAVAKKMSTTFKALSEMADWTSVPQQPVPDALVEVASTPTPEVVTSSARGLNLHHDIHIHLPSTSDTAVYTAIFRALRAELVD